MRRRFMNISNSVPLSFEALEDGLLISFSSEILYCINGGTWETLLAGENTEEINKGSVVSFRHAKSILGNGSIGEFSINKKCNVYGVCSSIIPKILGEKYMAMYLFDHLFYGCDTIVDASKLELPATTLAGFCYNSMFSGCTNLITAPELPATTLADFCYSNMFYGCTNLNYIKMLATDISASACLSDWVHGVASTGTFVKNPNMTTLPTGDSGIPSGWTVVNDGESGGGSMPKEITFNVHNGNTDQTSQYTAMSNMTWEEWIDSDYNPYLPNGTDKLFSKTDDSGSYSGYVYYNMYDPNSSSIDSSVEILDYEDSDGDGALVVLLESKIIENHTYNA